MISKIENDKKLKVAAGIKRFYSEGYICWSEENLKKLFGGKISEDDMLLLQDWERSGFISIKCEVDCYIEILKVN